MKDLIKAVWLPTLGVIISFSELILIIVTQFFIFGFILSSIAFIVSTCYLCVKFKSYRKL